MGLKFGAARTAAEADGMVPRVKQPEPARDPDHHALYWLFGRRAKVIPIESPKPLGKRARRRLRGRLKQERRRANLHT